MELALQEQLVEAAKGWLGIRYIHRGDTKKGCDCSGFVVGVIKQLGYLQDFVMPVYPSDWNLHSPEHNYLKEYLNDYCIEVAGKEAVPGDFVVFKFGKHISHLGILVDEKIFIHCYLHAGVKYGTLNEGQWGKRVAGYWKVDESKLGQRKVGS